MTDQVEASHILLMYQGSERSSATRSKEEALTQIQDIEKSLKGGQEFESLAQQHSDCPSGKSGGSLGTFGRGQMVGAFEDTAFGIEVGVTSPVIETSFGYHLIKRTG